MEEGNITAPCHCLQTHEVCKRMKTQKSHPARCDINRPKGTHRHTNTSDWPDPQHLPNWGAVQSLLLQEGPDFPLVALWLSYTNCTQAAQSNLCSTWKVKSIMSYHESSIFSSNGPTGKKGGCSLKFQLFATI